MTGALDSLDLLKQRVLDVRARLPFLPPSSVGHADFDPAPYYRAAGLAVRLRFDPPLTEDNRVRLNRAGRWVNEAAVVHLVAILLEYGVFQDGQPHRRDVEAHEHVSIARSLRNVILKEGGHYKREKPEHQGHMACLVALYGVASSDDDFPLDIDKVVVPMIEGCRRHAEACMALEK